MSAFFKDSDDGGEELFAALKELLNVLNYIDIQKSCLKVMGYLDLGRLEKGLLLFDTKLKSFQQHWMGAKKRNEVDQGSAKEMFQGGSEIIIQRGSFNSLHCKKGNTTTIENYRVHFQSIITNGMSMLMEQSLRGIKILKVFASCYDAEDWFIIQRGEVGK